MKKTIRRSLSVAMSIALLVLALFSYSNAADIASESTIAASKISEQLEVVLKEAAQDDLIPIYVWYQDIDLEAIDQATERKLGYTERDIQAKEDKLPMLSDATLALPDEAFNSAVESYREETRAQRSEVMEMQDSYTMTRRSLAREAYATYNERQMTVTGIPSKAIVYVSQYTPVVIAQLTPNQISNLAQKKEVVYIDARRNDEPEEELQYALPAVDANYVRNTLGFNGYGVKVGMFDSGQVGAHTQLNNASITRLNNGTDIHTHSTDVARIIVGSDGVAPGAKLYVNYGPSYESRLEALISQGVSVISISLGFGRDEAAGDYYTGFERWIDHIVHQDNVSVVTSAGNNGGNLIVTSAGLAYNVITVGAMYTNKTTSQTDDYLYEGSRSANGGTAGCAKPDVIASSAFDGGTSYAAPVVAGVIAQMIEYKPSIATNPALIKAVLTACTFKKANANTTEVYEGPLTAQQGAGVINAKRAISILSNNKYATGTMSSGTVTKTYSVPSGNTFIRYAVAWLRPNTVSNHTSGTVTTATAANLKLEVYRPTGVLAASSNITNSSVELVHYQVNSIFGTYSAQITRMDAGTNSFKYAVAWY